MQLSLREREEAVLYCTHNTATAGHVITWGRSRGATTPDEALALSFPISEVTSTIRQSNMETLGSEGSFLTSNTRFSSRRLF